MDKKKEKLSDEQKRHFRLVCVSFLSFFDCKTDILFSSSFPLLFFFPTAVSISSPWP